MKIIKRSSWTSSVPRITVGTEDLDDTPNFRSPVGISLVQPNLNVQFVERDPYQFFFTLQKEDFSLRGYADIQYNLAVTSNVDGIFCLRGLCNRPPGRKQNYLSILVLLGNDEKPTDLLVQNLVDAEELVVSRFPDAIKISAEATVGNFRRVATDFLNSSPPVGKRSASEFKNELPTTYGTETNVHTHELIENLFYWGYYRGRNDGVYGPITFQAVRELQADLREGKFYHKRIDGLYGRYTREAWSNYMKGIFHS